MAIVQFTHAVNFGPVRMLLLILFLASGVATKAQKNIRDSCVRIIAIHARWGGQVPFANMNERFGWGGLAGGGVSWKTKKNLVFQADYNFIYGKIVHEDSILKPLTTRDGYILDGNGDMAEVVLLQRGFMVTVSAGKLFTVVGPNPNSGLHVALGTGLMQHKIRIQENFTIVPALAGDYRKGYDRLSNGLVVRQQVGYLHHSNYRLANFYFGLDCYQGFTRNRRTLNYDTGLRDTRKRLDILLSAVVQWNIPLHKKEPKEFYFY